jgi:integrase
MTRPPVRKVATVKPVLSTLPQRAKAKTIVRTTPQPVTATRMVPLAKRPAPEPRVRTQPGPPAAELPSRTIARKAARPASPKAPAPQTGMALHTTTGARKYLTAGEREVFLRAADVADRPVRTLCMVLAYAGCRLSEALALTADRVDLAAGVLTIENLKKRRAGIYRAVPVPPALLETLDMVHGIREAQSRRGKSRSERLWPWSRMTGWRGRPCRHGSGRAGWAACLAEGFAAWVWRGGRFSRHPA